MKKILTNFREVPYEVYEFNIRTRSLFMYLVFFFFQTYKSVILKKETITHTVNKL